MEKQEPWGSYRIIAIDPGPEQSAYVICSIDQGDFVARRISINEHNIFPNSDILTVIFNYDNASAMIIEHIEYSYGNIGIGKSVTETVFWTGRFCQAFPGMFYRVSRKTITGHICGNPRAGDGAVIQALVDRFTPHEKNKGKGTKKEPGYFFGFHGDIWQAMAVAVYFVDNRGKMK